MSSIVKKSLLRLPNLLLPALLLVLGAASCNKDSETDETDQPAVTISTVAVSNFNLKADSKVLANLDSVFFSIDLNNGVIFNADSLPKGTNISRLIPVITFQSAMSEAKLVVEGTEKTDTINYLTNSTDSVDFTRPVTLKVTAADGVNKYSYRIKVNVHTQVPDSMMWDQLAVAKLPSMTEKPRAQRSVVFGDKALSLIEESNGNYTLSTAASLFDAQWQKKTVSLPFTPNVRSLNATPSALYILADNGDLYTSTNGENWTATGENWVTIIGPFLDSVLGVKSDAEGLAHCHYPASASISDPELDPEFPLEGRSDLRSEESKWSAIPTALFVGGNKPNGELSTATWAFDGRTWAVINEASIPAISGATLVEYVDFRSTGHVFQEKQYDVWILLGGKLADGSCNRNIYYSPDNGVTWIIGSSLLQLPEYFPNLWNADGIVMESPLNANISDAWTKTASKSSGRWLKPSYTIDGYDVTWNCPFLYIIGGMTGDDTLSDTIWRGVLARLTFTPIV